MSVLPHFWISINIQYIPVIVCIIKIWIWTVKRLSDRIPKKMYLTDSTVRLRSTELKGESEVVHSKWKHYWWWIWDPGCGKLGSAFYCHSLSLFFLGWPSFIVKTLPTSSHFFFLPRGKHITTVSLFNLGSSTYSTCLVLHLPWGSIRNIVQWTPQSRWWRVERYRGVCFL